MATLTPGLSVLYDSSGCERKRLSINVNKRGPPQAGSGLTRVSCAPGSQELIKRFPLRCVIAELSESALAF